MSIQTQIERLSAAKTAIKTAIEGKGVTVPDATMLEGLAALIDSIEAGGGSEIYTGSVTFNTDSYSFGVDVKDPTNHENYQIPKIAILVNTNRFIPYKNVTAMGIIDGMSFRHVGSLSGINSSAEPTKNEYYIRGASDTDDEYKRSICKFYGTKTWFYSTSLVIPIGSSNVVVNTKLFLSGDTYHYFIMY